MAIGNPPAGPRQINYAELQGIVDAETFRAVANDALIRLQLSRDTMSRYPENEWHQLILEGVRRSVRGDERLFHQLALRLFTALSRRIQAGHGQLLTFVQTNFPDIGIEFEAELTQAGVTPHEVAETDTEAAAQHLVGEVVRLFAEGNTQIDVTNFTQSIIARACEILSEQHELQGRAEQTSGSSGERIILTVLQVGNRAKEAIRRGAEQIATRVRVEQARGARSIYLGSVDRMHVEEARRLLREEDIETELHPGSGREGATLSFRLTGRRAETVLSAEAARVAQLIRSKIAAGERSMYLGGISERAVAAAQPILEAEGIGTRVHSGGGVRSEAGSIEFFATGQRAAAEVDRQYSVIEARLRAALTADENHVNVTGSSQDSVTRAQRWLEGQGYRTEIINTGEAYTGRYPHLYFYPTGQRLAALEDKQFQRLQETIQREIEADRAERMGIHLTSDYSAAVIARTQTWLTQIGFQSIIERGQLLFQRAETGGQYATEVENAVYNISAGNVSAVERMIRDERLLEFVYEDCMKGGRHCGEASRKLLQHLISNQELFTQAEYGQYVNQLLRNIDGATIPGAEADRELMARLPRFK